MDPALWELLRAEAGADGDRVLEAVIRLARPGIEIPDVRVVSRFGAVATCRIRARDVIAVRARPDVISLKAPRLLSPAFDPGAGPLDLAGPAEPEWRPTDARRSPELGLTGAGVVVAAIDWGVDVDSAAFRRPPDQAASSGDQMAVGTRFLSFWDQRDQAAGPRPEPYGYGTVHSREEIDRALQDPRPYERLGYHPAIADPRGRGTHGTRTMDIAAGNGRGGGPAGIAPDADLIFVHLADRNTGGLANFGDSVRLLEAVDFISRTAGPQPCVINISAGRICGPKDGTTLVERAFDELLAATPGRFVVNSAGNYFRWRTHSCGTLAAGESRILAFVSNPADITVNELEIWYDGADEFAVRIDPPGYAGGRPVCLGQRSDLLTGGRAVGRIYHRKHDPNNGDNHIVAFLDPIGHAGQWTVTLEARRVSSGRFHAWIERDDSCPGCQARFARDNTNPAITIGSIASSHLPLIVGAYDGHDPARPVAAFSSAGPCRDGRSKPDLAAPGVGVLAARSAPIGASRNPGLLVRGNGTSFATPHVTGAVALCFEAAGSRLSAREIRSLVLGSCDPALDADPEGRLGRGYLNIPRLVADVQRALAPTAAPIAKEPAMDAEDTVVLLAAAPATAYREYLYRPHGRLARWIGDWFDVVARPGQRIRRAPQEGDVLIEISLGRTNPGRCVTLATRDLQRVASWPGLAPGQLLLRPRRRTELSEPLPVEPVIDTGGDIGSRGDADGTGPGRLAGLDLPPRMQVSVAPDGTSTERDFGDDGAEAGLPVPADTASVPDWNEGETSDYLGGRLWTFTAKTLALPVAVFCPKAARALGTVGILVYAHGLLDGCPRPAEIPGGIVTDSPFALGRIVHASGRPLVLVVPFLDWAHPGGEGTFGKKHSHWHALASPDHLNGLIGEVLAELGRLEKSAAPSVSDLTIAGHSRAYDFLEPLAYSRMDKAMQEGALAQLSQVWAFDTTYAGKVERWISWLKVNPQLRIHVFYRPGSKTEGVGDEFYRERKARLTVTPVGEVHCAVPARRMAELLNANVHTPSREAEAVPWPAVPEGVDAGPWTVGAESDAGAPAPAAQPTAEELTARIARCIGIWETNRGKDNPTPKESSLDTVAGIHASMATIEQATMPYAITALRKDKALRDSANPPLAVKELNAADARAAAVPSLLGAVGTAWAQSRAPDDFIAANRALITATGLSDDDVRTMFRAEELKNTLAQARSDIEAAERAAREQAARENKSQKQQAAAAKSAQQGALKAAIDAIPAAGRLGLGEGSLRAYINTAANWGENRAAWQRKAVDNIPDNVGGRIEAVAVSDHGTALAIPTIRSRVDTELAKVPVPSTEDIVRAVAQKNNPHEPDYGLHVWQTYRRLSVAPQPSSGEAEEAETEEGVESGEVEAGEAETFLESSFSRESVPEQDTDATVTFPSGATLRVIAGPSGPGQEHYDPHATGNPLLDTSQSFRSTRLSANFTVGELARSGGVDFHIARIDPELVRCLQQLRDHVGKPVNITSGYRPYGYNEKLYTETYKKKPTKSRHSSGQAADVRIAGMSGMEIAKSAINACGPNIGVGIANTYAHLDVRGRWAKWTYFGDGTEKNELALAEIEAYRRQHAAGPGSARPASTAPAAPQPTGSVHEGEADGTAPVDQRADRWARVMGARLRPGNQVGGLVDGPETFGSILRAMHTATGPGHFIYLLGWWLDLDVPLAPLAQPGACARVPTATGTASTLRSVLHSADMAGVQVRAMLWDQTGSSKNTAEVGWVNGLLHGAAILDNNQLSATFGSQHQKIVVVAGSEGLVAFCGGIDINWDRICPSFPLFPPSGATTPGAEAEETASIAQHASGVMAESSGGSSGGGGGDPLHDVHVRLVGPAADDLLQVFIGRWYANPEHHRLDRTRGALRGLCQPPSPASGSALVRVEQTFNATFAPPVRPVLTCATPPPEGPVVRVRERGVQQIYLTAIEQARRFIYWEDQYMVHMCAAEALRRALPHVEYIILLMADSPISDLPHRWAWRKRFVEHIRRDPLGHKLHVFVLRDPATGGIGPHTYVHAKTMMVDDELSIIGSANCNRRGWESDTEVAAAIAGDADASGRLFAGRIRQRLWAEHLGVAASVVEDPMLSAPLWWLPAPRPARTVLLPGGRTVNLSGRRVRPYDVDADTDSLSDRAKPDDWVDPPAPLPGSPCGPGGLLSVAAAQQPLVAATGAPMQAVRFAVG